MMRLNNRHELLTKFEMRGISVSVVSEVKPNYVPESVN